VAGVRKLVVRRYPYLIYYIVDQAAVEVRILTIQHAARERDFSDA
jgi:toxin ParE1/3/4